MPPSRRRAWFAGLEQIERTHMSSGLALSEQQADMHLADACATLARQARAASLEMAAARGDAKNAWLERVAQFLAKRQAELLAANALDQKAAPDLGLSPAAIDRLRLTPERLQALVD